MKGEIVFSVNIEPNQVDAFKAFSKAMKVKPTLNIVDKKKKKTEKLVKLSKKNSKKQKFIDRFTRALNDVKLIKEGKLKTRPVSELLNEI